MRPFLFTVFSRRLPLISLSFFSSAHSLHSLRTGCLSVISQTTAYTLKVMTKFLPSISLSLFWFIKATFFVWGTLLRVFWTFTIFISPISPSFLPSVHSNTALLTHTCLSIVATIPWVSWFHLQGFYFNHRASVSATTPDGSPFCCNPSSHSLTRSSLQFLIRKSPAASTFSFRNDPAASSLTDSL